MMVMSALSFPQLKKVGIRPIMLFISGSLAIAVLPTILVLLSKFISPETYSLFIDQQYWRGLAPITGSWIGGSTSQLVLKELVNCPESLFLSVIVLDNILVNLWTIFMFQVIKRSDQLNKYFSINAQMPVLQDEELNLGSRQRASVLVSLLSISAAVVLINLLTDNFLVRVISLSLIGLVFGNFIPRWNHRFVLRIGGVLIIIIMAILGLRLDFSGLSLPVSFVMICIVWLLCHYMVMIIMAKGLNVHMAWGAHCQHG
jgi:hypothetical protein